MAKLFFRYGTMNSGKSMDIIKVAYNYINRDMTPILFNDKRDKGRLSENQAVVSRAWLELPSLEYDKETNFLETTIDLFTRQEVDCYLVDEAQFLTKKQVDQLAEVSLKYDIPVMCYWLKTDFLWNLFEWSKRLLEIAPSIEEIKTICWCGRKATMNARIVDGKIVKDETWPQELIWWDEAYVPLCFEHYCNGKLKKRGS